MVDFASNITIACIFEANTNVRFHKSIKVSTQKKLVYSISVVVFLIAWRKRRRWVLCMLPSCLGVLRIKSLKFKILKKLLTFYTIFIFDLFSFSPTSYLEFNGRQWHGERIDLFVGSGRWTKRTTIGCEFNECDNVKCSMGTGSCCENVHKLSNGILARKKETPLQVRFHLLFLCFCLYRDNFHRFISFLLRSLLIL